jgi:hypothetical protein
MERWALYIDIIFSPTTCWGVEVTSVLLSHSGFSLDENARGEGGLLAREELGK